MRKAPGKKIPPSAKTRDTLPLLLGLLVLAVAAAALIPFVLAQNSMVGMGGGPPPETQTQLTRATPGSLVKVACEVTSLSTNNLIEGTLLQRNSDGSYSRIGQTVRLQWNPNHSSIVMGNNADIHQGAVLQVSGHVGNDGLIDADQIVILTGAVTIQ